MIKHCFMLAVVLIGSMIASADQFVFTSEEPIDLTAPPSAAVCHFLQEDFSLFREAVVQNGKAVLLPGELPVGWYKVDFLNAEGKLLDWTSIAVLIPLLKRPSPQTPVAIDVALSWVPPPGEASWRSVARMAALAGVSMVRDRILWRDLQPEPGPLVAYTKYDDTSVIQKDAGLDILQVFHDVPYWMLGYPQGKRHIPEDLRLVWRFCREASARYKDTVQAWQPWNEGNTRTFGGHSTDELASHQKAAFFGFKNGNPEATVCWGPYAGVVSEAQYKTISLNHAGAYCDVYSMHSYDWHFDYPRLRKWVFEAAGGKPVWVSESDRGMKSDPESELGDLTWPYEKLKASFVVQSVASSLASGVARHFHFVLPWYMEQNNTVQFGLLRKDGSPRMGYVAYAAAGRLLADAHYLGQWKDASHSTLFAFAFRSKPHGESRDVLVAWAEERNEWKDRGNESVPLHLPDGLNVESAWDFLGRPLPSVIPETATGTPVFLVFSEGALQQLALYKEPLPDRIQYEEPCPVVLQFVAPVEELQQWTANWSEEHYRTALPGKQHWELAVYNFSDHALSGSVALTELPAGWALAQSSWEVQLQPMERLVLPLKAEIAADGLPEQEEPFRLVFRGDFGAGQEAHLAVAFRPPAEKTGGEQ